MRPSLGSDGRALDAGGSRLWDISGVGVADVMGCFDGGSARLDLGLIDYLDSIPT